VDFVLDLALTAAGGGLGALRYGMTRDEARTALDDWRQQPGPPGLACRDSGLNIAPMWSGSSHWGEKSRVIGISFGGPPDGRDRVLFDGIDLWGGALVEVVGQLRERGHSVNEHGPELYAIDDTDVWLRLERPPQFAPAAPHKIDVIVAPNRIKSLPA